MASGRRWLEAVRGGLRFLEVVSGIRWFEVVRGDQRRFVVF